MGIDIRQLSPQAQKQALEKWAAQQRTKHVEPRESKSKYHNTPAERNGESANIRFSSQKEARRYDELMLMLKAGEIRDLRLQEEFTLIEAYTTPDGKHVRAERYRSDFSYWRNGEKVVEDVKGGNATKTRVYAVKKKQMLDKYGITITEL